MSLLLLNNGGYDMYNIPTILKVPVLLMIVGSLLAFYIGEHDTALLFGVYTVILMLFVIDERLKEIKQ